MLSLEGKVRAGYWNAHEDSLKGERLENMGGNPERTREDLFGIVPLEASGSLSPRDYQDSDYITDTSNEKRREWKLMGMLDAIVTYESVKREHCSRTSKNKKTSTN